MVVNLGAGGVNGQGLRHEDLVAIGLWGNVEGKP